MHRAPGIALLLIVPFLTGCGGCGSKPPGQGLSRQGNDDLAPAPKPPVAAVSPAPTPPAPAAAPSQPATQQADSFREDDEPSNPGPAPKPAAQIAEPDREFDQSPAPTASPQVQREPSKPAPAARREVPGSVSLRVAVPDDDEVERAKAQLKQAFQDDLQRAERSDSLRFKHEFAQLLLASETKVDGDSAAHYVLLDTARAAAAESGDYRLASKAAETLIARYDVNALEVRHHTVATAARALSPFVQQQAAEICASCTRVLKDALQADDFTVADEMHDLLLAAAKRRGDRQELGRLDLVRKEIELIKKAHQPIPAALETLRESPDDPYANYQVGAYLCLVKMQWDKGLPHLAQGSSLRLKFLAQEEKRNQNDPNHSVQLADEYWTLSEGESALRKRGLQMRAVYFYQQAHDALPNGIPKLQAQRRLQEARHTYGEILLKESLAIMGMTAPGVATATALHPVSNGFEEN